MNNQKRNFRLKLRDLTLIFVVFLFTEFTNGQTVNVWLTTGDETEKLSQKNNLSFSSGIETGTIIDISKYITYQTIDGFGASLTGSSAYNIREKMSMTQRETLMNDLFSNNGIRLSLIRHSIGASDYDYYPSYSYDDMPPGQTDPNLSNFSLGNDLLNLVPSLKQALEINPSLKILGSPWTAPAWMKINHTLNGSSLSEQWYQTYADYFVKYIKAYQAEGIPIWAVTIQNEPGFPTDDYPSMSMSADDQHDFLKNYLGPTFEEDENINTGIIIYDHNWDTTYPLSILNDPEAKKYTIGTAFHGYGGLIDSQTEVYNAHPDKGIWFTERTGTASNPDFPNDLGFFVRRIIMNNIQEWAKCVLLWNLALDENNGPQNGGYCPDCTGLVTVNSTNGNVTKNVEYYALGHFSKFVDQGATRIFSTKTTDNDDDGIANIAFKNPDGSIVSIVHNASNQAESITVRMNKSFNYTLPGKSVVTFKWTPDQSEVHPTSVKVYINNEEKINITDITNIGSYPSINAVVGDELIIEIGNTDIPIPDIKGLPDLWFAQAFSREGIFMSSKSITPGAYKPWLPYGTTPHTTWITPFPTKWFNANELQSTTYPEWEVVNGKYRFKWTLQRTMDASLQYNNQTIDYTNKFPDEEVPWWQTLDENGQPILDGTGKFNPFGGVPHGTHVKPDGKHPQRQGKFIGQSMQLLHAMKGTLKTAYGNNTAFSDDNHYTAKTDGDDVYSFNSKDPSTEPFNVVPPNDNSPLYRPFVELWKVIPDNESDNPINDIVTWYQKAIHEDEGKSLPENYQYNGYEIWEDPVKNPVSKAPGSITLKVNDQNIPLSFNVQSPLEDDKFYMLYKANDDDDVRDFVVGTEELEVGMDKHIKQSMVDQLRENNSKFDLILPHNSLNYSTWDFGSGSGFLYSGSGNGFISNPSPNSGSIPTYGTIHPLTLNDDGTLSGDMTFNIEDKGKILPLTVFLSYRRTPESEPVIISGQDFWYSSWVEALKCLEYYNESESRSLVKFNFHITNFYEKQISIAEGLAYGLPITEDRRMNQEFVVMKGEKLTFNYWDDVDFAFKTIDTKWYVSSRKKWQQLSELVASKRIRTKLYKYADNGKLISETILQNFGQANSFTLEHTFNEVGNYVYEVAMKQRGSAYRVFVKVMDPEYYGDGQEGRVKVRNLLPREVDWVNATLSNNNQINGDDYVLAMVSDIKSSYTWKQPKDGGGPRSYMKNDESGAAKYIDRFAPLNDYADHYVYQLDDAVIKQSNQNVQAFQDYITTRESYFKILPGVWTNHMDPLGIGSKYGVQDEFNLENRIQDVTSSFIEDAFTEVQETKAHLYTVNFLEKEINSRSPREWEIKIPWGSYSKYHGFRLRDVPKAPVNAEKLKGAILKHIKLKTKGGAVNAPAPQVKYGILDTEEDKLEYMFLLNLKHNRWVVIPKSVNNVIFFHGSDQDNLIASGFSSNPPALSGINPVELNVDDYILVNNEKKCLSPNNNVGNQLDWIAFTPINKNVCEKISVSIHQDHEFGRIIKLKSNNKYLGLMADDETSSLSIVSQETGVIPYKLINHETEAGVYLGDINPEQSTAITNSKYKFDKAVTLSTHSSYNKTKDIVYGVTGGGLLTTSVFTGAIIYTKYLKPRIQGYEQLEEIEMDNPCDN